MTEVAQLLSAAADLAWPLVVVVLVWRVAPAISSALNRGGVTLEWGNKKLTIVEATQQLYRAVGDLTDEMIGRGTDTGRRPLEVTGHHPRVLWVDDHPENNAYETARLRDRGFTIVEVPSTREALRMMASSPAFDAVITDMGRDEGEKYVADAGLRLIREMRERGVSLPVAVYTTSRAAAESPGDVQRAGGGMTTSSPIELFQWLEEGLALGS